MDDEFEINKKKYYDALLTLDLERASRLENVNLNMIISLIERYKILSEKLDTIEQEIDLEKQKTKVHELIKSLAEEKVISELQKMPIDELNRDGNGIRIKTLKNAGYHNIESVYKESPNRISSIYGISGYATSVIKKIANDYAEQLRSSVKIQLNYDNKTEKSTKLVYNIYKYYKQKNIMTGVNNLKANDKKNLDIIQYENNIIRFFFKTSREKQEVIDAFYLLTNDYDKKYKNEVSRWIKEEESILKASEQEAWDDFNNNSIIYYSIIEELAPGVLGNDDEKYGLS